MDVFVWPILAASFAALAIVVIYVLLRIEHQEALENARQLQSPAGQIETLRKRIESSTQDGNPAAHDRARLVEIYRTWETIYARKPAAIQWERSAPGLAHEGIVAQVEELSIITLRIIERGINLNEVLATSLSDTMRQTLEQRSAGCLDAAQGAVDQIVDCFDLLEANPVRPFHEVERHRAKVRLIEPELELDDDVAARRHGQPAGHARTSRR